MWGQNTSGDGGTDCSIISFKAVQIKSRCETTTVVEVGDHCCAPLHYPGEVTSSSALPQRAITQWFPWQPAVPPLLSSDNNRDGEEEWQASLQMLHSHHRLENSTMNSCLLLSYIHVTTWWSSVNISCYTSMSNQDIELHSNLPHYTPSCVCSNH